MNAKERMYARITKHGEDLKKVFGLPGADPVKLCKRLHRLEIEASRIMTEYTNGDIDMQAVEAYREDLASSLVRIIGAENMTKIYINQDPRGYTLKLNTAATEQAHKAGINIHRDWGGYGILAPEFDGKP